MLYKILLFSVEPQHESAIGIHMSPPFCTSLPIPPLSVDSEPLFEFPELTADSHWLSILLEKEMATHSSILRESHGQKNLAGYSPKGCKDLDSTEHTCVFCLIPESFTRL